MGSQFLFLDSCFKVAPRLFWQNSRFSWFSGKLNIDSFSAEFSSANICMALLSNSSWSYSPLLDIIKKSSRRQKFFSVLFNGRSIAFWSSADMLNWLALSAVTLIGCFTDWLFTLIGCFTDWLFTVIGCFRSKLHWLAVSAVITADHSWIWDLKLRHITCFLFFPGTIWLTTFNKSFTMLLDAFPYNYRFIGFASDVS